MSMERKSDESDFIGLPQTEILSLLQEAARSETSSKRRKEIHVNLISNENLGLVDEPLVDDDSFPEGRQPLLDVLFVDTLAHRPDQLPLLFPVFAAVLGRRNFDDSFADVEWDLLPPINS